MIASRPSPAPSTTPTPTSSPQAPSEPAATPQRAFSVPSAPQVAPRCATGGRRGSRGSPRRRNPNSKPAVRQELQEDLSSMAARLVTRSTVLRSGTQGPCVMDIPEGHPRIEQRGTPRVSTTSPPDGGRPLSRVIGHSFSAASQRNVSTSTLPHSRTCPQRHRPAAPHVPKGGCWDGPPRRSTAGPTTKEHLSKPETKGSHRAPARRAAAGWPAYAPGLCAQRRRATRRDTGLTLCSTESARACAREGWELNSAPKIR